MRKFVSVFFFLMFLASFTASVWATPFQNGDFETFETGYFTGWSGYLTDNYLNNSYVDPDQSSLFTIVSNAGPSNSYVAQISNDDTYWLTTLYQDFTLDTLTPGWTMDITFWVKWSPTDENSDGISITISDLGYTDSVDLLSGITTSALTGGTWVTQDITSFAQTWGGYEVELAFSIWDLDFDTSDFLMIDNISFNQHAPANPVPEPATVLLLGSGLVGLVLSRRKRD